MSIMTLRNQAFTQSRGRQKLPKFLIWRCVHIQSVAKASNIAPATRIIFSYILVKSHLPALFAAKDTQQMATKRIMSVDILTLSCSNVTSAALGFIAPPSSSIIRKSASRLYKSIITNKTSHYPNKISFKWTIRTSFSIKIFENL